MEQYTASNGMTVMREADGDVVVSDDTETYVWRPATPAIEALREFFRAEEDERFGRWRSAIDPSWTAVVDSGPQMINFHHDDGLRAFAVDTDGAGLHRWDHTLQAVAREFLDSHPEPKPWHDARVGETWVLFGAHLGIAVSVVGSKDERWFTRATVFGRVERYELTDPSIAEARRIWPEDAS